MAKRIIGIEWSDGTLRAVVLSPERGGARLLQHGQAPCPDGATLAAALAAALGTPPTPGDRLAAALPAGAGFVRELSFPFAERRKIEAAAPLELAGQIPAAIDDCVTAVRDGDGGGKVLAAAVPHGTLAAFLAPFESAAIPLQLLDLAPWPLAGGLASHFPDAVIVHLAAGGALLLRLQGGEVHGHRIVPGPPDAPRLAREARLLCGGADLPGVLIGAAATEEFGAALTERWPRAERGELFVDGQRLTAEYLPAYAVARRAAAERGGFNLRRGPFALRGEWDKHRPRLMALAVLFVVALLTVAGSAATRYLQKSREADRLKAEMARLYKETFPGGTPVADVPLQMRGKLAELTRTARLGGVDRAHRPLAVMDEISRLTPADLPFEVREWDWSVDGVRCEATTSTFDAANRLAALLGESPLFATAKVSDARAAGSGNRIDFRLDLSFRDSEALP